MTHADVHDLIAPYALGALEEPEVTLMHEHLSGCRFCGNIAREAREVATHLAFAAPQRPAPPGSLERLLATVGSAAAASTRAHWPAPGRKGAKGRGPLPRLPWRWPSLLRAPSVLPVAATIIVALALAGWNFALMTDLHSEHLEMSTLQTRLVEQSHLLVMVTSGSAVTHALRGTALAPSAQVRLIMDQLSNTAMVMASRLPPLPPGHVYEVWLGRQGARLPAGSFTVDGHGDGESSLRLDASVHSYDSAWITVEPAQGGPLPNSPGVAHWAI